MTDTFRYKDNLEHLYDYARHLMYTFTLLKTYEVCTNFSILQMRILRLEKIRNFLKVLLLDYMGTRTLIKDLNH